MKKKYNTLKVSDFYFQHHVKTRFRDLDAFNHVNNSTFLSYLEDARILFFKRWSINFKDKSLIVASIKIDYLNQLKHTSNIIVCQKISRLGTKSFDNLSVIFSEEKVICVATITIVCYDFIAKKSISLYEEIQKDFNR